MLKLVSLSQCNCQCLIISRQKSLTIVKRFHSYINKSQLYGNASTRSKWLYSLPVLKNSKSLSFSRWISTNNIKNVISKDNKKDIGRLLALAKPERWKIGGKFIFCLWLFCFHFPKEIYYCIFKKKLKQQLLKFS